MFDKQTSGQEKLISYYISVQDYEEVKNLFSQSYDLVNRQIAEAKKTDHWMLEFFYEDIRSLKFDEAYFYLDKDGKRVYDMDMIREEFEENIETLIELNKQKGLTDG